ncbi:MAG: hypothetical protein VKJ06_07920 [Vampirovibrionales bacterium]|nr:hypothetical protein [Vampirovibrionales bacterium]
MYLNPFRGLGFRLLAAGLLISLSVLGGVALASVQTGQLMPFALPESPNKPAALDQAKPARLNAGIRQLVLPQVLEGRWQVTAIRETTNAPQAFAALTHDTWQLAPEANGVQLKNPVSGASVSAPLTQVSRAFAAFSRVVYIQPPAKAVNSRQSLQPPDFLPAKKNLAAQAPEQSSVTPRRALLYLESPEIQLAATDENRFEGVTYTAIVAFEAQKVVSVHYARYRLIGERIS